MPSSSGSTAQKSTILGLSGSEDCGEGSDNYRRKRDRNNLAVRLSRLRSKQRRQLTNARVRELRMKTVKLEESIKILTTDLNVLKQIFLDQATAKSNRITTEELKSLLKNPDNDNNTIKIDIKIDNNDDDDDDNNKNNNENNKNDNDDIINDNETASHNNSNIELYNIVDDTGGETDEDA